MINGKILSEKQIEQLDPYFNSNNIEMKSYVIELIEEFGFEIPEKMKIEKVDTEKVRKQHYKLKQYIKKIIIQ